MRDAGAVLLRRTEIHASAGRSLSVPLPAPMWGLSRATFDAMLLNAASDAGVRVRQPARCEAIDAPQQAAGAAQRSPGSHHAGETRSRSSNPGLRCAAPAACRARIGLRVRNLTTNIVESIATSHVLLADGKGTWATDVPAPTGDFGIKAHFAHVNGPRDAIELFAVRGSYGGLAPIEAGRWNAAFSVPGARLKAHRGNVAALFAEIVSENPTLARRLAHAKQLSDWLSSPLPRFPVRTRWGPNVMPVGNAAAALEPIGGEGIGLAMRSAELAAEALASGRRGTLTREYQRLWRPRRFGCRAAALTVSIPAIGNRLISRPIPQPMIGLALRMMGKQSRRM
jgi:menaquinone-9 beta-reductase